MLRGMLSSIPAAVLVLMSVACVPMLGCGADDETQAIDLTDLRIAYVDASGELTTAVVAADHGDTLDMGGFELSQSEILGYRDPPAGADSVTLAKGSHLDAYGDRCADIEYLHGMEEKVYTSIGDGEITAALIVVMGGSTASGKKITFSNEIGDDIDILVRRSEYWYDYEKD